MNGIGIVMSSSIMMIHYGMANNVSDCCTTQNIPWFIKSFNYWTTDDIELRMCSSEGYPNEATPIDIIELYIR